MGIRYYKKESPANKPTLGNGIQITFTTLDYVTGYFATTEPYIHQQFEIFMRRGEYGISEITAEEFTRDYLDKKKSPNQGRPQREEIGAGTFRSAPAQAAQSAPPAPAAAADQTAAIQTQLPPAPPSPVVQFKPPAFKRSKKATT